MALFMHQKRPIEVKCLNYHETAGHININSTHHIN